MKNSNENSRPAVIIKMLLLCHHIKSHQGCSVVSVGMLGVCLLDLSHSLRIIWRGSGKMMCLTYFDSVSKLLFHFNAVFWSYGNRVINLQSEPLNRPLCESATGMIWARVCNFPFFPE